MSKGKCPDRILGNAIHGLIVGVIGGAVYVGATGLMQGKSVNTVVKGMGQVPYIGLQVCACTALYSGIDCILSSVRGKDDLTNVVLSGAATGAIIGATHGPQSLAINAALGAVIAGVLDGGILR